MRSTGILLRLSVFAGLATALAAGPALGDVVCKKKSGLMVIRTACKAKESSVDMASFGAVGPRGLQGPQGIQGIQGIQGLPGTPATALWAVVNSDGTLARGSSHVVSTADVSSGGTFPGSYEVIFDQDVTGCAYVAGIGLSGTSGQPGPGEVGVVGRLGNADGVFVATYNSSGTGTNNGFHIAVFCP